ncbi:MAG: transcription-repair coupling factor [Lachnospiraceae bacterium]|nr:transcription-repair coupling factor [Lachnospiraceae bacterium]
MKSFTEPLSELKEYADLKMQLSKGEKKVVQVSGCIDTQKPHFIYSLADKKENCLIVTFQEQKAKELYESYRFFDRQAVYYPAKDVLFYQSDIRGNLLTGERLGAVKAILEQERVTVITSFDALMDRVVPLDHVKQAILEYGLGDVLDVEEVKQQLVGMGYERNYQVETAGQFAVRGGILDIFPLTDENPCRIELWGDEIDSMRRFDVESQRSIENLEHVRIYPASEVVLFPEMMKQGLEKLQKEGEELYETFRKEMKTEEAHRVKTTVDALVEEITELEQGTGIDSYLMYFLEETVSFLDYFDSDQTLVFLDEPARLAEKGRVVEQEFSESMTHRLEKGYILPGQMQALYSGKEIFAKMQRRKSVALTTLDLQADQLETSHRYAVSVRTVNSYNRSFELLVKDLRHYRKNKYRVILLSGSRTRAGRLAEDLQQEGLSCFYSEDYDHLVQPGEVMVAYGKLKKGFEYPDIKFVAISESDIFGGEQKRKKKRRIYEGEKIQSFTDLSIGDYVVHERYGIGVYRGIEKVEIQRTAKDYVKIEYDKGSTLYVLATQLEAIQKYAGAEAKRPKINRLDGPEWSKTRSRVKGAVKEIARELVELYAARQQRAGFAYGTDTVWQKEFEELFPFEETEDQELAIEATKRDMESQKIMDRLICGDVGYGKTEIAIRAAFKAVQDGKQVVYLVPTTILAQQHYNNFVQRMKDFPVRVDLMCRFCTNGQVKKTVEDLKRGIVDIVIGTHRVLSKDVAFKDLGLLIIDEEQRFGVTHKEKIKQMKNNVDVLTLTATPIPRTLHMSLIGIRDMSVLEEPPMDRIPIQTYVMEYNEEIVREAIHRELAREGQVYYVFNRVNQIVEVTSRIAQLVPEANVAFAHGQMKERELENIMYQFINGEIDVLVSTTIIETGLDISNVNTMMIHDADNMGLSQLYQLRGRVGRSNRTAYAFLMYRQNKMLKEVAEKRLSAIKEFTELGSGFKIAMRDLEIRGAGNLLGAQQHGHMEAVGYDLYCKMLNEAVKSLKGEVSVEPFDTTIELEMDAFIPPSYIPNEFQKLDIYKRIAVIENQEEKEEMLEELIDRFGEPPRSVENLLTIAQLKAKAHKCYYTEIKEFGEKIKFTFYYQANIDPGNIAQMTENYQGGLQFIRDAKGPYFEYTKSHSSRQKNVSTLEVTEKILEDTWNLLVEKKACERASR